MPDLSALISQMTLEEKAALCTGASAWTTTPVERLGIPEMMMSDGPHGVRRVPDMHDHGLRKACRPPASPPPRPGFHLGRGPAVRDGPGPGRRGHRPGRGCALGPGVNMKRSPLGGRNFEYFSEDPYPGRANWRQPDRRHAEQGRGHFAQAFRRQQPGVPALHDQRRGGRAHAARDLPAGL